MSGAWMNIVASDCELDIRLGKTVTVARHGGNVRIGLANGDICMPRSMAEKLLRGLLALYPQR